MKNLQKIREQKGFSQTKVGTAIESSQEIISAYENDKYYIGSDNLCKLADFFQCSTDYLLDRTNDPTPLSMLHNEFTPSEVELLSNFKMLSKEDQDMVSGYVLGLAQKEKRTSDD